ncbi:MAG: hypothetical protein OEN02_12265 [Gammaproteobacteria bacterium]|nr:hypothetical protein [Gammaproteobacteria bacterium]MDH3534838.1 hypothetical protein [Gammaproteobacteria bacterium]
MNDFVRRLRSLALKQQEKIKELEQDNQRLNTLIRALGKQVQTLEETRIAIDFATAEIPVDLDLVPEYSHKNYGR